LRALNPERYDVRDVFVSPECLWHLAGVPATPERALRGSDAVINCIRGRYGADGWLSGLLAKMGHRAIHSRPAAMALAFDKEKSKAAVSALGVRVPLHRSVARGQDLDTAVLELFRGFSMPAVVKPLQGAGAVRVADIASLRREIEAVLERSPRALVEEHIAGREATVGVVGEFRGQPLCVFVNGDVAAEEKELLAESARLIHRGLGLRHYGVSEFIVNRHGVWYLKTDALPALYEESPFVRGLQAEGIPMPEFLDHVIGLAAR
jgi:hypothetical protein